MFLPLAVFPFAFTPTAAHRVLQLCPLALPEPGYITHELMTCAMSSDDEYQSSEIGEDRTRHYSGTRANANALDLLTQQVQDGNRYINMNHPGDTTADN